MSSSTGSSSTGSTFVRSIFLCVSALLGIGAFSPFAIMAQPIPELAYDGVPAIVEHDDSMLANAGFFEAVIHPTSTRGYQTIFSKDGNGYLTGGHVNLEMRNGKLVARIQSTSQSFRVDSGPLRVPVNVDSLVRVRFGPDGFVLSVDDVVTALARLPIGPVRSFPPLRQLYIACLQELHQIAGASGVTVRDDIVDHIVTLTDTVAASMRSSLQVDLERGKRLEVESLQGTVVRLGERFGMSTPVHALLYAFLKVHDFPPTAA